MKTSNRRARRRGLTLMELTVVLAILAITTTLAVTMSTQVIEQGRYDATRRGLDDIRTALFGVPDSAGAVGYVADMGGLPPTLNQLWNPAGLPIYASYPIDTDGDGTPDGSLSAGWRGPYLRLGFNNTLQDGWGHDYFTTPGDATTLPRIESAGADGIALTADDLYVSYASGDYLATITVQVQEIREGVPDNPDLQPKMGEDPAPVRTVEVRVFRVVNGVPVSLAPTVFAQSNPPPTFTLQGTIPFGPIAVRAIMKKTTPPDTVVIEKRSPILYWTLTSRSNTTKHLVLR